MSIALILIKAKRTAYSRRRLESGMTGSDERQDPTGMIGGHEGGEVGRRFLCGLGMMAAPIHKQTVGPPGKYDMDPNGISVFQAALIIAPRDV